MKEEASSEAVLTSEPKGRQRSTILFPYNDLDDAVDLVKTMYTKQGSMACTVDQLAAWMGHDTIESGAFRNKLAAARYFGLVDTGRQLVNLTQLGEQIVEVSREPAARVKAFLSVPLYRKLFDRYRGRQLPPDLGLENEMKGLGVSPKQSDKARQVFRRSASQAGFFASGSDRLVQPADTVGANGASSSSEKTRRSSERGGTIPPGLHPKLRILLSALPLVGESWTEEDKQEWLDLVRSALDAIYPNTAYLDVS